MEKVIDFLEKKVEWIVIGLGGLFVLFMTWTYVLQPVANVELGGNNLGPGEVDPYTLENVGNELKSAMEDGTRITVKVPEYMSNFKETMSWSNAKPFEMAGAWPLLRADVPVPAPVVDPNAPAPPQQGGPNNNVVPPPGAAAQVTALPVPPAPTPAEHRVGRSMVLKPDANGQLPPPPQPGQEVIGGVDVDWVTQMFKINLGQLNDEFVNKKIPPPFNQATAFLQVEMEREELDENGQPIPGTLTVVPPLPVHFNNVAPPPMPIEGAAKEQQMAYLEWAKANTPAILQPVFYTVAKGNGWEKPGAQVAAQQAFDPRQFLTGDIPPWVTPEQRQQIYAERRAEQARKAEETKKSRPQRTPTPSRGGGPGIIEGGGGGAANYAPKPNYAAPPPRSSAPPRGVGSPGGIAAPGVIGGDGIMGMDPAGMFPGQGGYGGQPNTPAGLPVPGTDYPNGEFDPAKWKDKTIEAWAHDETGVAGKTYQYRLRYKIKNPIWNSVNVAQPPELAEQFALVSEWSKWSSPVTIPPLVNFFVATTKLPQGTTVRFDVFKWDKGTLRSENFQVAPGDQIGGVKGDVDFSTGWTIVDFRDHPSGETQILLMNDQGRLVSRSRKADEGDALYKGLKDQINQAKTTETAAANGAAAINGK